MHTQYATELDSPGQTGVRGNLSARSTAETLSGQTPAQLAKHRRREARFTARRRSSGWSAQKELPAASSGGARKRPESIGRGSSTSRGSPVRALFTEAEAAGPESSASTVSTIHP